MKPYSYLSADEKLDAVLDFLYGRSNTESFFENILEGVGVSIKNKENAFEVSFICDQLTERDRLVFYDKNRQTYLIQFASKRFKESGGYVKQAERENAEAERAKKIDFLMGYGAMGAGIFSFLYLVWLVFSYGLDHHYWYPAHWLSKLIKHILVVFS